MRFVFSALLIGLLAVSAGADTIHVPDEELGLTAIHQGVLLAEPGDTVLVAAGVYDSVHTFQTPIGLKHAVVAITKDIVLQGASRTNVVIDQQNSEYGILCQGVGRNAVISNLTITGGASRDQGLADDGDGRFLTAAIACVDGASPTISAIDIESAATGIIVRSSTADSAPLIERVVIARGSHHGIYIYQNGAEPVDINRDTIVDNFDYGLYVSDGAVIVRNTAITNNGKYGISSYLSSPEISYCNVYWNDRMFPDQVVGPLNYGPSLTDQTDINGNISSEPYYCDFWGAAGYNYSVCRSDPVSPHYQAGEGGVTIGAMPAVCTNCISSPVEPASWGAIKALYR